MISSWSLKMKRRGRSKKLWKSIINERLKKPLRKDLLIPLLLNLMKNRKQLGKWKNNFCKNKYPLCKNRFKKIRQCMRLFWMRLIQEVWTKTKTISNLSKSIKIWVKLLLRLRIEISNCSKSLVKLRCIKGYLNILNQCSASFAKFSSLLKYLLSM